MDSAGELSRRPENIGDFKLDRSTELDDSIDLEAVSLVVGRDEMSALKGAVMKIEPHLRQRPLF